MKYWIQTASGLEFDLENPTENVDPKDVALALAHINRFTGHAGFCSVAEHSLMVAARCWQQAPIIHQCSDVERMQAIQTRCALLGLVHDAGEAYIGDISQPLKELIRFHAPGLAHRLKKLEETIVAHLVPAHVSDDLFWPLVKRADLESLEFESRTRLKYGRRGAWPVLDGIRPLDFVFEPYSWPRERAPLVWAEMWMRAYRDLKIGAPFPFTVFIEPTYK